MENITQLPTDRKIRIVTHSGSFHADELLASAVLDFALSKLGFEYDLVRTRDPEVIAQADIVYDVGGVYDPESLRFDHHQQPGPTPRADGTPYSSFGLVWKHFGPYICDGKSEAWDFIEKSLAIPVDSGDNGVELYTPVKPGLHPVTLHTLTFAFGPTWKEREAQWDANVAFFDLLDFAKRFISRMITIACDNHDGVLLARSAYAAAPDKRIIELDRDLPWEEPFSLLREPLIVLSPRMADDGEMIWRVETVRDDVSGFSNRCPLPESWRGKIGPQLEEASGIQGALFCHKTGFLGTAKTKAAAHEMAMQAIKNKSS